MHQVDASAFDMTLDVLHRQHEMPEPAISGDGWTVLRFHAAQSQTSGVAILELFWAVEAWAKAEKAHKEARHWRQESWSDRSSCAKTLKRH